MWPENRKKSDFVYFGYSNFTIKIKCFWKVRKHKTKNTPLEKIKRRTKTNQMFDYSFDKSPLNIQNIL